MKKILIIDNRSEMLELLKQSLTDEGFELSRVKGGKESKEKAAAEKPDLILLDFVDSEKSCLSLCSDLTRNPATAGTPVLIITGAGESTGIEAGFKAGAFDYLKRPFDKTELLARVRSALRYREIQSLATEFEKANIFSATVVTTNHKIKQPLTLINLCSTAIKREVGKSQMNREYVEKKISQIETAGRDITDILNRLGEIEHPSFADYLYDIKMVDLGAGKNAEEVKSDPK